VTEKLHLWTLASTAWQVAGGGVRGHVYAAVCGGAVGGAAGLPGRM